MASLFESSNGVKLIFFCCFIPQSTFKLRLKTFKVQCIIHVTKPFDIEEYVRPNLVLRGWGVGAYELQ